MSVVVNRQAIAGLRRRVFAHYARYGRSLPFRKTTNSYRIALSEFMLQQTQVERVLPKYRAWLLNWPSWHSLAQASPADVIRAWSGLGYNRRAMYIREMAVRIVNEFSGTLPMDVKTLRSFRGIGPYTASAIVIFVTNADLVALDTNIRKVLIHELALPCDISAENLESVARRALPKGRSREWHNALMDYAALALPKPSKLRVPVTKQSRFDGSTRQLRGKVLREIAQTARTKSSLKRALGCEETRLSKILSALTKEGLLVLRNGFYSLPE